MTAGLVRLDDLPSTPDPHIVLAAAADVLAAAAAVDTACDTAAQTWHQLPNSLSAPGYIEPLFTALTPVTTDSADLLTAVQAMHRSVETFAGEIQTVRRRAAALAEDITAFYVRLGVDLLRPGTVLLVDTVIHALGRGDEFDTLMRENIRLDHDVQAIHAYWSQVQHEAAHALLAITCGQGRDLPRSTGATTTTTSSGTHLSAVLALESLAAAARQGVAAVHHWGDTYPNLAALLQTSPPDAQHVNGWWNHLPGTAHAALIAGIPAVVGNLEGVTYAARSQANRTVLHAKIAQYEQQVELDRDLLHNPALARSLTVTNPGLRPGSLTEDTAQLAAYTNILAAQRSTAGIPRSLVALDTSHHPPLAAVAIGDLDTAATVTYAVPGMGATTTGINEWANAAKNLYLAQTIAVPNSYAVVAWVGYQTPPIPAATDPDAGVLSSRYAEAGAGKLDAALGGLNAVRRDDITLNVVAHSYGTTTASLALASADENVHSLVLIGSAGIDAPVNDAHDIHADHVYAGQASDTFPWSARTQGDKLAWIGRDFSLRQDPMHPSFDATTFATDGKAGPDGINHGAATTTHDTAVQDPGTTNGHGYLDPGSESLYNIVQATTTGEDMTPYVWSDYTHLTAAALLIDFRGEVLREGLQSAVISYRQHGIPDAVITQLIAQLGSTAILTP